MRLTRIFQNSDLTVGESIQLDSRAHNYIYNVLRLKANDSFIIFNGTGIDFNCTITSSHKKAVIIQITDSYPVNKESTLQIHLGQAILKSDHMDFSIQKSVELGVSEITPLQTDFCGFKLSPDRLEKKMRHWEQIIISACEQCHRSTLPTLHPATNLKTWFSTTDADLKLIFDTHTAEMLTTNKPVKKAALTIGPEGGFSNKEINLGNKNSFFPSSLGPRILRSETASTTAVSIIQYLWGDLK